MKKLLINLLNLVVAVCAFGACDGVENSITQAGTFANVFKVNGSQIVVPSTGEAYTVSNISSTGLKSGDKAYLEVSYCYDSQTMATPVMNVEKVCAPVESLDICSSSEFNAETRAKYNSPLKGICAINLYTLDNYGSTSGKSDFLWADDETQNIVVRYDKDYIGKFKMALDSVVEGTLCFRLYSELTPADGRVDHNVFAYDGDPSQVCKILSFKMKREILAGDLTAEDSEDIRSYNTLMSTISLIVEDCKKDETTGLYKPRGIIKTMSEFKNLFVE